jgi:hypothetical protein
VAAANKKPGIAEYISRYQISAKSLDWEDFMLTYRLLSSGPAASRLTLTKDKHRLISENGGMPNDPAKFEFFDKEGRLLDREENIEVLEDGTLHGHKVFE